MASKDYLASGSRKPRRLRIIMYLVILIVVFSIFSSFLYLPLTAYRTNDNHNNNNNYNQLPINQIDKLKEEKISRLVINNNNNYDVQDEKTRARREKVKEMMKHAWDNYAKYAWGENELKPISRAPHYGSVFGNAPFGITIMDSLDTLYIMGLHEEFKKGRDWVANSFNVNSIFTQMSVFETNIRAVGGLLTCFSFTGDEIFKQKAKEIADKLLPAFETDTGIPVAKVYFGNSNMKYYGGASVLSEFGTLHLEFEYLSDITGDLIYKEKVKKIRDLMQDLPKVDGLYKNYVDTTSGKWGSNQVSMGALGDSFYEYLIKSYIQTNKEDLQGKEMFEGTMIHTIESLVRVSKNEHLMYFGELSNSRLIPKMGHLACFSGGMLALASHVLQNNNSELYMNIAKNITNTCHVSYLKATKKLGPETFWFSNELEEASSMKHNDKYYILRPETIESYFVLYRLTKDPKYREWGWEAVEALEKNCRVPNGFSGVKNVYSENSEYDDVQQSFFMAETLKYLYLLFSDESFMSLDEWVYNTEAHPLPIQKVNKFYRSADDKDT